MAVLAWGPNSDGGNVAEQRPPSMQSIAQRWRFGHYLVFEVLHVGGAACVSTTNKVKVRSNNSKTSCCLPFVLCWPLPGGRIRMEVTLWSNGHHPCSRLHSQGGLGTTWTAAAAKPKSVLALGSRVVLNHLVNFERCIQFEAASAAG